MALMLGVWRVYYWWIIDFLDFQKINQAYLVVGWREFLDYCKCPDALSLNVKIDVFWPCLEVIDSKFHPFPLQFLVRSDPSSAHFLSNFQNLVSLQLAKFIYGKWLILIAFTKVFKIYELLFKYYLQFFFKNW